MIKVLNVLNRMGIGGPAFNAVFITEHLPKDKFEAKLIAGQVENHETTFDAAMDILSEEPFTIPEMKRSLLNPINDYKAYWKLRKYIREFKPDVVHTHSAKPGLLGRLAAKHENVPVIIHTFHGHTFHSYFGKAKTKLIIEIEKFLTSISTKIIAISELQRKEIVEDFKVVPNDKMVVLPLGFDIDQFTDADGSKRKSFREEFNVQDHQVAIGIIGRLVAIKNHQQFLRGLKIAIDEVGEENIKAFIVGDGDARPEIEQLATSLGISFTTEKDENHDAPLVFTSWRNDVNRINSGLDIITLTSLNEGTPVALIEAQASNTPIVSTKVGGVEDIVIENETALLCDVNDIDTFANHLIKLINDKELREKMSVKGYNFAKQEFDYSIMISRLSDLYERLLNESKKK